MDESAINWLRDNAPAFVKAAIDAQENELRAENVRLQVELKSLNRSVDFYHGRVNELQKLALAGMPEPWATLCFDIIANGRPRDWGVGEFLKEQA